MLSPECLGELRSAWLPNISNAGLERLVDLLQKGSPLLISGCFTRAMPMGCLASHAAWHHPRTERLILDAGITWLHHVAGLNPATSQVLREWDTRGAADLALRSDLITELKAELQARQNVARTAGEAAAVFGVMPAADKRPPTPSATPRSSPLPVRDRLEALGQSTYFAFRATLALPFVICGPGELLTQLNRVLLGALPLAVTAGAAIGVVVWMHLRGALLSVGGPGAVQYLPQALSLAVVLEFAPLAAGLIVAGRSGASLARSWVPCA